MNDTMKGDYGRQLDGFTNFYLNLQPDRVVNGVTLAHPIEISLFSPPRHELSEGEGDLVMFHADSGAMKPIMGRQTRGAKRRALCETLLHPALNGGLCFMTNDGRAWLVPPTHELPPSTISNGVISFTDWRDNIIERNKIHRIVLPPGLADVAAMPWPSQPEKPVIERATEFPIYTSQEMDLFNQAQCNGKKFNGYSVNDQAGAIIYQVAGLPHQVRLALTEEERIAGLAMTYLESMVRAQDADAMIATSYILGVLAPPPHLPARPYAGGWIDFDDVIKKIGWYPQSTKDRREMHARIWEFVKFGERAHIIGKRTGARYTDGEGNEINTSIHGATWRVMNTETPDQPSLYEALETPVCAEIVVSKELTALLTHPKAAQYLGCAEILGVIPGGKPAGAWARSIGAALMSFWRRNPREVMNTKTVTDDDGNTITISDPLFRPTRRELLDHYAAKVSPYDEVLRSKNPARAIEYWCTTLQILADNEFIERNGEAAATAKEMKKSLPPQGWKDIWLDQPVTIEPSLKRMKLEVVNRAKALPASKPRDLKRKPKTNKKPKS